jgi:glycosyltransferase involved in cell wall biosynthesis
MEDSLLKKVDVTIVTQDNLLPRRAALCRNTFCVPNGADTDLFREMKDTPSPPILDKLVRPRLGFVGHVQYWIDLGLIAYLAKRRPEWSFILIGPIGPLADTNPVKGLPNVHFIGRKPQAEIPALLAAMDVCLNPYHTGELANNCSPLKLYEYLAAGKPVVSTVMPEAAKFAEDVRIGVTYEAFLKWCDDIIGALPENEETVRQRIARANRHSWKNRFYEVNQILERTLLGGANEQEPAKAAFDPAVQN